MSLRLLSIFLVLCTWFQFPACAQDMGFTLLPAPGTAPSARFDGAIAYDPVGRRIFLFGGQDSSPLNDLWAYSLVETRWTRLTPSGTLPPARFGHTLNWDAQRRRLIVFGGQARGFFSDVWAFDPDGGAWRQLASDGAGPSRRYGHSAVYDERRDRIVISHGFTDSGRFDDTWAFQLASGTWRDLSPATGRPLRRCLHRAVLDPAGDQMFLYGGCASGFGPCPLGDLWSFDLSTNRWTERTGSPKPPSREHYGMAFDVQRERIVLFGGQGGGPLADLWEYDGRSGAWAELTPAEQRPQARSRHESSYAADTGTSYFFGGTLGSGQLTSELWAFGPSVVEPRFAGAAVRNAFNGETGSVAPGGLVSIYGSGLGPVEGLAGAFDPATDSLPVSLGGVSVSWNGVPAPLLFVRADQVNLQVPYEMTVQGTARVVVRVNGRDSQPVEVSLAPASPGLFPRIWNADGSVNSPQAPAQEAGIIVLYATGQGPVIPAARTGAPARPPFPEPTAPVELTIGGTAAEILFRGLAPGTAGVLQINARVPAGLNRETPQRVQLTIGGRAAGDGPLLQLR